MSRIALLAVICAMAPSIASANLATYRCLLFSKKADTCRIRIGFDDQRLVTYEVHCAFGPRFADTNSSRYEIEHRPENGYVLKLAYPANSKHADKYFTIHVKTQQPGSEWPNPGGLFHSDMNFEQVIPGLEQEAGTDLGRELAVEDAGEYVSDSDGSSCPVVKPYPIDKKTLGGFCLVLPNH